MSFILFLLIFGIGLTAVYALVSLYSRSIRREKLEDQWAEDHPDGGDPAARDDYIETGMAQYHSGLRRKLILLVYVVPVVAVAVIWWFTN